MRARLESEWPDGPENAVLSHAGSLKAWLVKGTRRFAVDPRRRFGRHPEARRLLATDGEVAPGPQGAWGGLISALQRHTVHGELAQLQKEDRQILSLAYLSGHTNREIAAMLHVSVSTVRRRLAIALARLEESMRRAGTWVSALALFGLFVYNRMADHVRTSRWPSTAALAVAGTASAVTLGVVVVGSSSATAPPAAQAVRAQTITVWPRIGGHTTVVPSSPVIIITEAAVVTKPANSIVETVVKQTSAKVGATAGTVCGGKPTNGEPARGEGSRSEHAGEAGVSQSGSGGCAGEGDKDKDKEKQKDKDRH